MATIVLNQNNIVGNQNNTAVIDVVYSTNPQIVKDVVKQNPQKWKNDGEKKRGVMGLWSQTIERRILVSSG